MYDIAKIELIFLNSFFQLLARQGELFFHIVLRCKSYTMSEVFVQRSETRVGQKIIRFVNRTTNSKTRVNLENETYRRINLVGQFVQVYYKENIGYRCILCTKPGQTVLPDVFFGTYHTCYRRICIQLANYFSFLCIVNRYLM